MRAGRRNVRITHPEKSLFPDGTTKADLAAYYRDVAPAMLPHVRERPVSMQRFNGGVTRPGFFAKEGPEGAPDWVPTIEVPKKGGTVHHVLANETATLVWLANQNCITPHVSTARADRLHPPGPARSGPGPPGSTARTGSCGTSTPRATTSTSCAGPPSTSARCCATAAASRSRWSPARPGATSS